MKKVKRNEYLRFLAKYCARRGLRFLEAYYDNETETIDCYCVNSDNIDSLITFKAGDFA